VIVALRCKDNLAVEATNRDQVEHVLSQLDPAARDLIALRLEGHPTADVARMLGLHPDVTRVRLSRLRQNLHEAPWMAELV